MVRNREQRMHPAIPQAGIVQGVSFSQPASFPSGLIGRAVFTVF